MGVYLDTRDLESRRQELEGEHEALKDAVREAEDNLDDEDEGTAEVLEQAQEALDEWDDFDELKNLNDLRGEFDLRDWRDGVTFIPESEFKNYAMDLAEDLRGSIEGWPFDCIDWEQAAQALAMDYSSVEYDGETYLYRV